MIHRIHISSTGELEDIPAIGDLVQSYCRLHRIPDRIAYHLRLALDELLTNTMSYGFSRDAREHLIDIRLQLSPPWLITEVEDNGPPFNPLEAPTPDLHASVENRAIGGLGIHLVRSVIDHLDYRHHADCNILQLRQALPEPDGDAGDINQPVTRDRP